MMIHTQATTEQMLGQAVKQLSNLSAKELPLVLEFLYYLQTKRPLSTLAKDRTPQELVAEIRQRAEQLKDIPRSEIVARFRELTEEIRQTAIENGTAIDGDWVDD
ncbi:hypothetical protein QUF58_03605 [Anaerolineales bacterium HSG24]|nr:hypothetical protein [Anaerolineales bacterium HSG24]